MTPRRFAVRVQQKTSLSVGAALDAQRGRLPLELALSVAADLVSAVADAHRRGVCFGRIDARDVEVHGTGELRLLAKPSPGADVAADMHAVGAILYRLFTGLTPRQARVALKVSSLHEVPSPAQINPALDDTLDTVVAQMLASHPAARPQSMRQVEAWLADVCEELEVQPSRAAVLRWAKAAPRLVVVPAPRVVARAELAGDVLNDDDLDDDALKDDAPGPLRFDAWAVAACAFSVVALVMATTL
jgi:hypothetical protein